MIPITKLRKLFGEKQYEVSLFKELGFSRKKCSSCGSYFWSLDPDQKICGDTACIGGYQFLKDKNNFEKWDFHQAINKWSDFFEKNGHKRINDYPVVARWRDDIFFTIASIADFQPWVLNGTIDPPANPLVVPQPCIRFGGKGFCDIDNVGKTGRHLSLFIMGGQHAFNSKIRKLKGYWMDECIAFNFDFLVNEIGVDKEQLSYREDIWQGGGNFGPSLEVFYKGLEVVNNVFMQYESDGKGNFREMDFKVIDVGWGLERIAWLTQNTPTIYDAAFGPIMPKIIKETGVEIPDTLLREYAIISGLIDQDDTRGYEKLKNRKLSSGLTFQEAEKIVEPLQALYAILDHLRTFVFALADGAIPSNIGGGYNIRTMLRRVFSLNNLYSFNLNLPEICHSHIKFLKKSYPRLEDASYSLDEILKLEEKRYTTTLDKGRRYLEGLFRKNIVINEDKMREIYESRGISPEMIRKIAKEFNVEVKVPSDFYVNLTKKKNTVKDSLRKNELRFKEFIRGVTTTKKLYYEDPYAKTFEAKILKKFQDKFIILDQTLFYPLGGGQIGDTGKINTAKVIQSFKVGDIIIHEVDNAKGLNEGDIVKGYLDWERRFQLMQHHTAAHIVNQAARAILGKHIWQAGAEKTPKKGRLDITHFKAVTREELLKIEKLANRVAAEDRKIIIHTLERGEAEKRFGFRIYQGGAVPGKILRIVEIDDWDVEACGGTHLSSTGQVGLIKIMSSERIQDGVVRLEFLAGNAAVEYIQKQENELIKISTLLNVPLNQVYKATEKFFNLS
ncbi:MAG: alanine--tRNA ligase, partial [Candidatus Odinarchaeia archaeon]